MVVVKDFRTDMEWQLVVKFYEVLFYCYHPSCYSNCKRYSAVKDQVNYISPTQSSWIFHKRVIAIVKTVEPHFLLLYTTYLHYLRNMPHLQCLLIGFVLDALKIIVDQNYLS